MKKRMINILLACCIITTLCAVNIPHTQAASTYNATGALDYAKNHWNDGVGLCSEFVSKCLNAGGCPVWSASCTALVNQLQAGNYGILNQLTVESNGYLYASKNADKISIGDPVFFYCANEMNIDGRPYVHVMLYSGADYNGFMKCYAHNYAMNNTAFSATKCYYCGSAISAVYAFHMNPGRQYTVTFDSNMGVGFSSQSKTVAAGNSIGELPVISRSGYKLVGWSTEKNGGMIINSNNMLITQDTTLYAMWQKDSSQTAANISIAVDNWCTLTPRCALDSRMDVDNAGTDDKTNIQLYTDNGTDAQIWKFTRLSNGYYTITSKVSGKALAVASDRAVSGTNVWQYSYSKSSTAQQWKLQDAGDGYYYIVPRQNRKLCLDVDNAGTENGTNIQVWSKNKTDAQKWKINLVG